MGVTLDKSQIAEGLRLNDASLLRGEAYVGGRWVAATGGATFDVVNPSDEKLITKVPDMTASDVSGAVAAAENAFGDWRARTAKERAILMRRWYDLIVANADDLALLLTLENGKPLSEASAEILYAASFVDWFAEEGRRADGDIIPAHRQDTRILVLKQPIGVVAAITPWNFPSAMITRKVAPAIAVGCTVVAKPAEQTPLSALALAELADRAGIPPGVINVVTGLDGPSIGKEFCANPLVRKVTFTGSTGVGRILMSQCAPQIKKISLELGGNAPFIVFDDADIDAAVEGAITCKFRNAGQTCVCANRLYVQEAVYEAFADKLTRRVNELRVGDGFEQNTEIGPLIDQQGLAKVKHHISDALENGASIRAGGAQHERGGTYFQPTVLCDVTGTMRLAREETFGPVAPLFRFSDEEDVIAKANDTEYGLAAYFYARDMSRVWRVAEALEYGMVGINTGIISNEIAPFGGIKQSGIGREGSKYGTADFMELKYLCMGGIT